MQMIDVLKRLAELDAGNPNVENKMGSVESLMTVSNVDGEVAKINENVESVEECGPGMAGPSMAPRTPASINMTAGSGDELAGMLRTIMSLAGIDKGAPETDKHIELSPVHSAEPDNDMMSTIKMIDSMNTPEEMEMEADIDPDDMPNEEMDDRVYDNSPEEEIEAHDYGDKQVDPKPQGFKQRVGDNPYKPARESVEALANRLLGEFHEYINEGKKAKPDFLDMDKDGNKKEPMKKAIKDKKSKKKVKESDEVVSELTKGAKWRYTDAARKSLDTLSDKAKSANTGDDSKKFANKALKRQRTINKVEKDLVGEEAKPSAGLSKAKKSAIVKKAKAGGDIGKKGKGFEKIADKAAKKYGSKESGKKVAAAAMWKNIKR